MTSDTTQEESKVQSLLQQANTQAPAPDDVFLAALRQSSADAFATAPPTRTTGPTRRRLLAWLAPIAALLFLASAIAFWPAGATQALAWPQVKSQLQFAQELQFTFLTTNDADDDDDDDIRPATRPAKSSHTAPVLDKAYRVSFLAPDRLRLEKLSADPNKAPELLMISSGGKTLTPNPTTKLFIIEKTRRHLEKSTQDCLTALASVGGAASSPMLGTLDNPQLQLKPGLDFPFGGAIAGKAMRLVRVTPKGDLPFSDAFGVNLVFDKQNQLTTAYLIKKGQALAIITFNLHPKLNPALFDLKGPPGYTDVEQGIFPRLPDDLKPIADAYYKARQRITHYRMAVLPGHDQHPSINVRYRQVRDGELWRLDEPNIFAMYDKKQFYFPRPDQVTFDTLWAAVGDPDLPVDQFVLTYKDNLAQGKFFEKIPRSGWLIPPLSVEVSDEANEALANRKNRRWYEQAPERAVGSLANNDLRQLAWPSFIGDRFLTPFGWDTATPPPVYYHLPSRPDRPGLIGIRAVSSMNLTEYWIDPAKDSLCIHYVQYFDNLEPWKPNPQTFDSIAYYANVKRKPSEPEPSVYHKRDVTQTAQTADGRWYPRRFADGTVVFLDTKGPIDPAFFAWPQNIPEPGQGKGLVEKGPDYYVGTPEANERQARWLTEHCIREIQTALERYIRDHNNTWPDSLAQLVDATYLKPEQIISPRRAPAPFIYIKPKKNDKPDAPFNLILYEPPSPWPVGLNDDLPAGIYGLTTMGQRIDYMSQSFIKTQKEFDALLPK